MFGKKKKVTTEDNRDHKSSTNKIINNDYYSKEIDTRKISFNLDPSFQTSGNDVNALHLEFLLKDIEELIKGTEYEVYIKNHDLKLNKSDINKVYYFIVKNLKDYTKTDLFSQISEYFDIDYHKFFNSLSNKFKEELMLELEESSVYKRRKINKLF